MSIKNRILDFMKEQAYKPLTAEELLKAMDISRDQRSMLLDLLRNLEEQGAIIKNRRGCYGVPERMGMISGRLQGHAKGFAFLIPDNPNQEDVYIHANDLKGAMHNDKVLVRKFNKADGRSSSGEVVRVLERSNKKIVGKYEDNKNFGFVVPDDNRISYDVFIPQSQTKGAKEGQKVVVEITKWPEKRRNPEGEVVEILGYQGEPGVDIEAIIKKLELPEYFPEDVRNEVEAIPDSIPQEEIEGRRDLRDLKMVTIDGEDAKDFDDAVSIERLSDGKIRLGVHIADVTHYVRRGSALNKEAFNRATSIYLVDRVIPMLPEKLSNNMCSLRSDGDRLAMTVLMSFEEKTGKLLKHEIIESVIRVNHRLTYTKVNKMLIDEDNDLIEEYNDMIDELRLMGEFSQVLRKNRFENGSIDFDFPEAKIILDDEGKPVDIIKVNRGIAEKMIEDFMIRTNEVVAEDMFHREIPFIYRVHEQPSKEKLESLNSFVHNLGYHIKGLKGEEIHPKALQNILDKVKGEPEERVVSTVLLRSMQQAHYSPYNIGHFGLASRYYSHFTSPIRRYPDLMIHRIIKEVINKGVLSEERISQLMDELPNIADHCSVQERRAMDAEYESLDLKKVEYMEDKVGEQYEGIISSVMSFGFFVELDNTVEGLVHVSAMRDDYYHYYEDKHAFIGERTGNSYQLGDKVKVELVKVNLEDKQIDFDLVIDE
ncbi:RNAse R [Orenia metallireducens]|uniref:Ribonuclease R n=1 Tax=Orenia metallireducens TaxID=1413210 RepID=A0A285H5L0_9FIRM|nr:ribonuclease R [Orenia metallireducens]PRX28651.1 RNAse R [Orenia metallireducens]SNY31062.1 RNAse R [Orenia metallireducens]